ncbi:MAG TPA: ComEC/Rec2 family competence protein [Aeromicrobium sp.]|nr:ComEC/Rec2 family competence protein [Aeromicrobium sp.]
MIASASDLRIAPAALGAWVGVALLVRLEPTWSFVAGLTLLVVASLGWHRRWVALSAIAIAVAFFGCGLRLAAVEASPATDLAEQSAAVDAELTLRQDARVYAGQSGPGTVLQVTVRRVQTRSQGWQLRQRATAFLSGDQSGLRTGETIVVRAKMSPADRSDEVAQFRVLNWQPTDSMPWWWRGSEVVRQGIRDGVDHRSGQGAALVPALVAGDESALTESTRSDFQRTGLTHLLAVSGANLTIVLALVVFGLRAVRARPVFLLLAAALTIISFVLVARPEPSVQRAAVMGSVALVAMLTGSAAGGLRALAWAVLALLAFDPWLAGQPGFILSVLATCGIIVLANPLADRLSWLPTPVAQALAVPLAAHLFCLPVVAFLSGEVSLVAVFANMAAAPAVAPATILGLGAGLLDLVAPSLAVLPGELAFWSGWSIVQIGSVGSRLPGAAIDWSLPWWTLIAIAPVIAAFIWSAARRPVVFVGLALGLCVALVRPPSPGWPPKHLLVVACDVGQGDGFVVPTAPGEAIVIDAGPDPALIDRCLQKLRIKRIPLLLFTHAHADHIDGAAGAARGRKVGLVAFGPTGAPQLGKTPRAELVAGQVFSVGPAQLEVLWPRPATGEATQDEFNDLSVVVRLHLNGRRILFTGDIGEQAQRGLAQANPDLSADILKVAHHGSADQWPELFDRVNPAIALIGVGADNPHGHPTESLLAELNERGISTWRTDRNGDVAVVDRAGGLAVLSQ